MKWNFFSFIITILLYSRIPTRSSQLRCVLNATYLIAECRHHLLSLTPSCAVAHLVQVSRINIRLELESVAVVIWTCFTYKYYYILPFFLAGQLYDMHAFDFGFFLSLSLFAAIAYDHSSYTLHKFSIDVVKRWRTLERQKQNEQIIIFIHSVLHLFSVRQHSNRSGCKTRRYEGVNYAGTWINVSIPDF